MGEILKIIKKYNNQLYHRKFRKLRWNGKLSGEKENHPILSQWEV